MSLGGMIGSKIRLGGIAIGKSPEVDCPGLAPFTPYIFLAAPSRSCFRMLIVVVVREVGRIGEFSSECGHQDTCHLSDCVSISRRHQHHRYQARYSQGM